MAFPAHSQKPAAASTQPSTTGRLAPIRSSIRPPICDATTKPMKKYSRYRLACEDDCPSATCAYRLAKKKTGTKASMATPSTRFSTRKGRMRNMLICMSGDGVRISTK